MWSNIVRVALQPIIIGLVITGLYWLTKDDIFLFWFMVLFCWRYVRFLVNVVGFTFVYRCAPPPFAPSLKPNRDITVVLPTIDPLGRDFDECLQSCALNMPAKIIIITAGEALFRTTQAVVVPFANSFISTEFIVEKTEVASKRQQVGRAIGMITTSVTVFLDDHVFWGRGLLPGLLRPFEDPTVGIVATSKRVRRTAGLSLWRRCWNMLGALYLERHNFEIRATNAIDGGVFVVSGRTSAIRTEILQRPDFLPAYLNEKFFFGKFGPLSADDDNFITRFVVKHGWSIKVQYSDDVRIDTTLGVDSPIVRKFLGQCTRWARTTWRSNSCALFTDRTVWYKQPYCTYAVYLTSFTNFALIIDPLLFYLLARSNWCQKSGRVAVIMSGLGFWILLTKTVKVFPYYARHPADIVLFPVYLLFAYFHSLIKLYALLTFYNCAWSGRNLEDVTKSEQV